MTFEEYVTQNRQRFLDELKDFCSQPSVAAQNLGMNDMAHKVQARLEKLGAHTKFIPIQDGFPVVYGELGNGAKTLLIYDHYDVQPPEPLDLWTTPPWEPTIRDGKMYARGIADNKSDTLLRMQAVESWLATEGALPLKIKWVIEGEEEIGSPHLGKFVQANQELVKGADGCLWEFGAKDGFENPMLICGLKGIIYLELHAHGAAHDLHSGAAAIVENPAWRLVWALSTLKNERDEITIDGYNEHVRPPNELELEAASHIPFDTNAELEKYGIKHFINNVRDFEAIKKLYFAPTVTICGLYSGYTGPGGKTVLPNHAFVKLDFRLVPEQSPELIEQLLRKHLDARGFTDIEIKQVEVGEAVARSPLDSDIVRAAKDAARSTYGREAIVYPTAAGSGPMYELCQRFGIPAVSAGGGYPHSHAHAPNENIRINDYFEAIHFIRDLIKNFAAN
ncbi:MAG TPA: M20/M25/M40 family metallo-hydrolase [Anaerolineae bacterium]|nr:M20/M25/M40 family metallo-hydrolase [Anaerolineae bacterium]